jgi:hypothetical protein
MKERTNSRAFCQNSIPVFGFLALVFIKEFEHQFVIMITEKNQLYLLKGSHFVFAHIDRKLNIYSIGLVQMK